MKYSDIKSLLALNDDDLINIGLHPYDKNEHNNKSRTKKIH